MTGTKPPKLPAVFLPKGGKFVPWHCHRCGNPVDPEKAVVLEEDGRITEFHDFGVPAGASLGFALFGKNCASHLRKRARHSNYAFVSPAPAELRQIMLQRMDAWKAPGTDPYVDCLREILLSQSKN